MRSINKQRKEKNNENKKKCQANVLLRIKCGSSKARFEQRRNGEDWSNVRINVFTQKKWQMSMAS